MTIHPREEIPTGELVREALDEARALVRAEIQLAKDDVRRELARVKTVAIFLGLAVAAALVGTTMLLVALALAIAKSAIPVLVIGLVVLAGGGIAAFTGYKALPRKPLGETLQRLEKDLRILKEQTT